MTNQKNDTNRDMITVTTATDHYNIYLGEDLLFDPALLQKHIVSKQIMIVSNETVSKLYLKQLMSAFKDYACDTMILPDGEEYKNFESLNNIIDALVNHQHHRDTTLIALGGGVIGDMTGFVASCYHRGVAYIQIPTTLLAQVDSSIGGKTAINHAKGKNLIGAFYQPKAVIIDINTLMTLPNREFNAGLAEIIKAALIDDADFFAWLEKHLEKIMSKDKKLLKTMIQKAIAIKTKIVALDEKEKTGTRALLNLGHTFGHAIEQNLGYGNWLHGEAVAMGIIIASRFSLENDWITQNDFNRILSIFKNAKLPLELPSTLKYDKLYETMMEDKKIFDNKLHLILLKSIGKAIIVNHLDSNHVQAILKDFLTKNK